MPLLPLISRACNQWALLNIISIFNLNLNYLTPLCCNKIYKSLKVYFYLTTEVYTMSVVFSVRISKKLKKLMDECKDVDWAEEVRTYINRRARELLMEKYLRIAREARKQLDKVSVPVDELIREDREREY